MNTLVPTLRQRPESDSDSDSNSNSDVLGTPWRWIVLSWTVLVTLAALQMQFDRWLGLGQSRFWLDLLWTAAGWSYWLLAAPLVLYLGKRFPLIQGKLARRLPLHLLFSLIIGLAHTPLFAAISFAIAPFPEINSMSFGRAVMAMISWTLHAEIVLYWAILGASQALASLRRARERERRAAQLELQLGEARLEALRSQLRPHFLFNALNTIAMLTRQGKNKDAVETVAGLGRLLRATLNRGEVQMVSLDEELELVQLYLDIEQVRFADRLQWTVEIEPQLRPAQIPSLILQPLVENAIRHGLSRTEATGSLTITAKRLANRIELTVSDNGPGPPPDLGAEEEGIGLGNTRARLRELYGSKADLRLKRLGERTEARLLIPLVEEDL